jgi:hypothetical protein
MNKFLNHLSEYANLTDEEITKRASTGAGLDVNEFFMIALERDFCKSAVNNIIERLQCIA